VGTLESLRYRNNELTEKFLAKTGTVEVVIELQREQDLTKFESFESKAVQALEGILKTMSDFNDKVKVRKLIADWKELVEETQFFIRCSTEVTTTTPPVTTELFSKLSKNSRRARNRKLEKVIPTVEELPTEDISPTTASPTTHVLTTSPVMVEEEDMNGFVLVESRTRKPRASTQPPQTFTHKKQGTTNTPRRSHNRITSESTQVITQGNLDQGEKKLSQNPINQAISNEKGVVDISRIGHPDRGNVLSEEPYAGTELHSLSPESVVAHARTEERTQFAVLRPRTDFLTSQLAVLAESTNKQIFEMSTICDELHLMSVSDDMNYEAFKFKQSILKFSGPMFEVFCSAQKLGEISRTIPGYLVPIPTPRNL
jgi:hypothetical protein